MVPTTCSSCAKDCSMQEQYLLPFEWPLTQEHSASESPVGRSGWSTSPTLGCTLGPPTASLSTAFLQQVTPQSSLCTRLPATGWEYSSKRASRHYPERKMPFSTHRQDQVTEWFTGRQYAVEPRLWHSVAHVLPPRPAHTRMTSRCAAAADDTGVCATFP